MRWTLRRRISLVGLLAVAVGVVLATDLVPAVQRARTRIRLCTSGLSSLAKLCEQATAHPSISALVGRATALLVLVALLVPALRWAAGWCLAPLRQMTEPLSRVGPTNLGHRVQARSDRDLAVIGDAVDAMMERVAEGYEGQRRFAANASHELRTPLSVQRTLIEVGLSADTTPEQLELLTRQLLATNERNERLIEGLLVLAETDQGLASRTPQRLDQIVAAVVSAHSARADAAGLTVHAALAERTVAGERVLLERLVTNLMQNAIKYNRPGGTVQVSVGDRPALSVVNTGVDVPAERAEEIFQPFRRLSGTRTDHSGGSGLGLTIARSITTAHGGHIQASPQGTDGLRVDVDLP